MDIHVDSLGIIISLQWQKARDSELNLDAKLFTKGIVYPNIWCSMSIHCLFKFNFPLYDTQPSHCPPDDFSRGSVESLFAIYKSKIEGLMFSAFLFFFVLFFFVHLSKKEHCVYGTMTRDGTILHLIDIKWWSYDAFHDTFNNLHDVMQQF